MHLNGCRCDFIRNSCVSMKLNVTTTAAAMTNEMKIQLHTQKYTIKTKSLLNKTQH